MERRWTGQSTEAIVYEVGVVGVSSFGRTALQEPVSNGPSKSYRSNSARTLTEECFTEKSPTHIDPH